MTAALRTLSTLLVALALSVPAACAEGDRGPEASPTPPPSAPADTAAAPADIAGAPGAHPHAAYDRLREALGRYETLAEEGLPRVPDGDLIEVGDTSARVADLRARLAATGDLGDASRSGDVYTEAVAQSVRRFQRRRGLAVDGLLGANTLAALNTPAAELVDKIEASLERWGDLPDTLGARYLFVNVPEFKLRAFEGDAEALEMKVVVGKAYDDRATPLFSDRMEYLIFGPYWNIPHSIATEEILPEAREDLGYLEANDYEIVSHYAADAEVYEPTRARLGEVAAGDLRLRQRPGPENALGRVKFIFPNEHAVYLHDTPADGLFDETERAFSHGCIRVERPADLAAWTLKGTNDWTTDRIRREMNNGERRQVMLDRHIPVYILYWTAYVDDDGTVHFRDDLYDRITDA